MSVEKLLAENFDHLSWQRGKALWRDGHVNYVDQVSHNHVDAAVASSNGRGMYEQSIALRLSHGEIDVQGECSCPVGYNCKHVAAAMLAKYDDNNSFYTPPSRQKKTPATPAKPAAIALSPAAQLWLAELKKTDKAERATTKQLLFALLWQNDQALLCPYQVTRRKDGSVSKCERYLRSPIEILNKPPGFLVEEDYPVLHALHGLQLHPYYPMSGYLLHGKAGYRALRAALTTGRLYVGEPDAATTLLRWGAPRQHGWQWQTEARTGHQRLSAVLDETLRALPLDPPLYFDAAQNSVGELHSDLAPALSGQLLRMPALSAQDLALLKLQLEQSTPLSSDHNRIPWPENLPVHNEIAVAPRPCLRLTQALQARNWYAKPETQPCLRLSFMYDAWHLEQPSSAQTLTYADPAQHPAQLTHIRRDMRAEKTARDTLLASGPQPQHDATRTPYGDNRAPESWSFFLRDEAAWMQWLGAALPPLQRAGWQIEFADDFPFQVHYADTLEIDLEETSGYDWFGLSLDIEINGKKHALAPLLAQAVHQFGRNLLNAVTVSEQGGMLMLPMDAREFAPEPLDGKKKSSGKKSPARNQLLAIPAARLAPMLHLLHDWLDTLPQQKPGESSLRLSRFDLGNIAALDAAGVLRHGAQNIRAAAGALAGAAGLPAIAAPSGLHAQLRPYQQHGLAWLDFLRQHGLNGILADDMGLGKTLQTLALLQAEKQAGRLTRPTLIVMPTSLLCNWRDEAARFTPELRVQILHGSERKHVFASLTNFDLILTTYALIPRDMEVLQAIDWHYLVLDESQRIKNARTQAAQVLRTLKTNHRLCLSGTPLENHLGELWAQFDFLLPGLLGDTDRFRRQFRTPIEKQGNAERAAQLAQRVRPFILRRTKEQVAAELPAKTETLIKVELEGTQRDLYETVRVALDKKVRDAISKQGFARSQIIVLDALLKLRQVCCDPRLIKTSAAQKSLSAKRRALLDMLPELIEEGRRVLIFSSFAQMLELLEADLHTHKIPYCKLTGASRDRAVQVKEFQEGSKPVFLITLKAGGVGLNLTAADTVILYDPWWNPAAEQQAIDRAHRIGQHKPVFVYKLIAAGTLEERMLQMQSDKRDLADRVLSGTAKDVGLTENDFSALLAPLE